MELTTAIRERLCRDGGEWTLQAIRGAFPGARVEPALEWLSSLGLVVATSAGAYQAVDRWGRPIPSGTPLKPPEYRADRTPGRDKGAVDGPIRIPLLCEGVDRARAARRRTREQRFPRVLEMVRSGASFRQAIQAVGYSHWMQPRHFPEWHERIEEAIEQRKRANHKNRATAQGDV